MTDIQEYFRTLKDKLEYGGFKVGEYREINYGIQFNVELDGQKYLIRVYNGKKGIRMDLSQIKNESIVKIIEQCTLDGKIQNNIQNTSAGDPKDLIGTDESGKGDYFGPLVVAGVYVDERNGEFLRRLGVDDSKKLSDKQIGQMAPKIMGMCPYSIVVYDNENYNELYGRIKNLNRLLASGHAAVIENVLEKVECKYVLSDQFGDSSLIENALMERGRKVILKQRYRAEENVAVACASILARYEFVRRMDAMEMKYGIKFPKGASSSVIEIGREFVSKFGPDKLKDVAKLNFKTTADILDL